MKKTIIVCICILMVICTIGFIIMKQNMCSKINLILDNPINTYNKSDDTNTINEISNLNISASIPIFMYHWIKDDTGDYAYPENMVKPAELRKQMEYLKQNNYDVIFVSQLDELQHYNKPVILTFDDGWEDVYIHAFPIAKELNMKICMYVITDLIGTPGYCTLEQLKEMKASGLVEIDSHTLTHPYLDELSFQQITEELVNSKIYIKEKLDIESSVICYPSGRVNNNVIEVASENYQYGLLMDGGIFKYDSSQSNMYLIPRIYAMRSMTLNKFISYCEQSIVKIN